VSCIRDICLVYNTVDERNENRAWEPDRAGQECGWPLVSYGQSYKGVPIDKPDTWPDLAKSVLYWVPVIAQAI
jgi:glucose/arabinose dehydrogenase